MAISFVGAASAAASSLTLPTHQARDLLLFFAYRNGSATPPTVPSGWTSVNQGGNNNNSSVLAFRLATASGTASGTWTDATHVSAAVYRAGTGNINIGAAATTGGSGNTLTYSGITLQNTGGGSWVAGFGGHRQATDLETPPTGMTNRTSSGTTGGETAGHDTNAGVSSWASQNVTVSPSSGGTQGWRTAVIEIREFAAFTLAAAVGAFSLTGIAAAGLTGFGLQAQTGAFTLSGQQVEWLRDYSLHASPGEFEVEGEAQLSGPPRSIEVDSGAFNVAGGDVAFRRAKFTPPWQPSKAYVVGDVIRPATGQGTGLFFRCIVAGATSVNEPFWPTVISNTVVDGGVTWLAVSFIAGDLQQPNPSAIIELFELQLFSEIHGVNEVYRFHPGTNLVNNGDLKWRGITYLKFPVEADGFEYNGQGQLPRPKIRVSNIFGTVTAILLSLPNGLEGARVTRIRTLAKYLDSSNFPDGQNPFGDPDETAEFPREIFFIDRKISENRDLVEFEIVSAMDLAGIRAPKRQCIANICQWRYRSNECGYTGTNYFDASDRSVGNASQDVCGKRLNSCRVRFGQNAELPFGSYPGIGRTVG